MKPLTAPFNRRASVPSAVDIEMAVLPLSCYQRYAGAPARPIGVEYAHDPCVNIVVPLFEQEVT